MSIEQNNNQRSTELSSLEKQTAIQNYITADFNGDFPEVLISNSGAIVPTRNHGYRTLSYSSVGEHGIATGSRTRVIATAEIAHAIPDLQIIANSYNRFDNTEPTMASVVESELVKRGVERLRISKEVNSFSTLTQITEMINLSVANQWKRIAMLSNQYHVPRMRAMFEMLDSIVDDPDFQKTLEIFKDQGSQVSFVAAEPIMRLTNPHYVAYLNRIEKSEQYQQTLASEAQGIKDLLAGKYQITLHPENPRQNHT